MSGAVTRKSVAVFAACVVAMGAACGDDTGASEESSGTGRPAADVSPEVAAAAEEADGLGLQFATSHDQIVEQCREEGSLHVQASTNSQEIVAPLFAEAYPFIDVRWTDISGAPARERFLLEVEGGAADAVDVAYVAPESYSEFAEMTDWDLYGMTEAGILDIPLGMINPERHTVADYASGGVALAYNSDLVDRDDLPTTWDQLADPEWSRDEFGMVLALEPKNVATLAAHPDWPLDRVVELAAGMAENDPVFTDRDTAGSILVQTGEVAIFPFVNVHSAQREIDKDPDGPLRLHFIEPVPIREADSAAVYSDDFAESPHCALLYLEWLAGDEAMAPLNEDVQSSFYWEGDNRLRELIGDREVAIAEHDDLEKLAGWMDEIFAAYGFPAGAG